MLPTSSRLRFLVAESEPPESRESRRQSVGRSSGETYVDALRGLATGAECHRIEPADANATLPAEASPASYDGVFLTGLPLHLYQETPETRRTSSSFGRCLPQACLPSAPAQSSRSPQLLRENGSPQRARMRGCFCPTDHTDGGRTHPSAFGPPPPPVMHRRCTRTRLRAYQRALRFLPAIGSLPCRPQRSVTMVESSGSAEPPEGRARRDCWGSASPSQRAA